MINFSIKANVIFLHSWLCRHKLYKSSYNTSGGIEPRKRDLAAAQRIPQSIRTRPSGLSWQGAKAAKLRSKVVRTTTAMFPLTARTDVVRSLLGLKKRKRKKKKKENATPGLWSCFDLSPEDISMRDSLTWLLISVSATCWGG